LDLIGENSLKADTEIIIIAAELLKSLGLSPDQVMIKINNRRFLEKQLKKLASLKKKSILFTKSLIKKTKWKKMNGKNT